MTSAQPAASGQASGSRPTGRGRQPDAGHGAAGCRCAARAARAVRHEGAPEAHRLGRGAPAPAANRDARGRRRRTGVDHLRVGHGQPQHGERCDQRHDGHRPRAGAQRGAGDLGLVVALEDHDLDVANPALHVTIVARSWVLGTPLTAGPVLSVPSRVGWSLRPR